MGEQESSAHGRRLDQELVIGRAMRSYLAGDPLRSIAENADMSSYQMLRLLSTRVGDRSEQQRSKSLRKRCLVTAEVLRKDARKITQLVNAGIERSDVPTVLAALGAPLDIDIAAELLKNPDFLESQDIAPAAGLLSDKMGLLYVTGYDRRIEPDYVLALGKVPLPAVDEFRRLLSTQQLSRTQIAQIVAVIETTAEAIGLGDDTGISYSDYEMAREAITLELGDNLRLPWPAPAELIRSRAGAGFWDDALESVGTKLLSSRAKFSKADYANAARAYRETEGQFGGPKDVASYDSWMIAEVAAGRDRPSVVAIRRRFGTWESVISAFVPLEEDELKGIVSQYKTENAADEQWARAGELVSEVLSTMPWNSFLSIDYGDDADGPRRPYAQANPSADGVWCEIVSEEFLPADQWPIDADYLLRNSWSAPDDEVPNWHKQGVPPIEAGHQILEALRYGRSCDDPKKVRWHSGDFPGGPGPDGGVILNDEPGGVVRNLRSAS